MGPNGKYALTGGCIGPSQHRLDVGVMIVGSSQDAHLVMGCGRGKAMEMGWDRGSWGRGTGWGRGKERGCGRGWPWGKGRGWDLRWSKVHVRDTLTVRLSRMARQSEQAGKTTGELSDGQLKVHCMSAILTWNLTA